MCLILSATCTANGKNTKAVEEKKPISLTEKTCNPSLKNWTKAGVEDWLEKNDLKHLKTRYAAAVTTGILLSVIITIN